LCGTGTHADGHDNAAMHISGFKGKVAGAAAWQCRVDGPRTGRLLPRRPCADENAAMRLGASATLHRSLLRKLLAAHRLLSVGDGYVFGSSLLTPFTATAVHPSSQAPVVEDRAKAAHADRTP
jgi:hypothetical protein